MLRFAHLGVVGFTLLIARTPHEKATVVGMLTNVSGGWGFRVLRALPGFVCVV